MTCIKERVHYFPKCQSVVKFLWGRPLALAPDNDILAATGSPGYIRAIV